LSQEKRAMFDGATTKGNAALRRKELSTRSS